jgi:hypothetical protein
MAHDVFVSHSSKDKPTADAVCAVLESQGIRCWIAPRDIIPGREWGASIIEAIKGAKVMVLIFSTHANGSPQINKEVERAVNKGIPVIPMRIEEIVPTESLEFFLSSNHWLDAFSPPLERHLQYLAQVVRQIIGGPVKEVLPTPMSERALREKDEATKLKGTEKFREPPPRAMVESKSFLDYVKFWLSKVNARVLIVGVFVLVALAGFLIHHHHENNPLSNLPPAVYQPGTPEDNLPVPK